MHPILASTVAAVRTLADLHDVGAIGRCYDRQTTILFEERCVVGTGKFKTLGVENRDIRIEERRGEPHPFNLDADALAFLGIHCEVVDVLIGHDTGNRNIKRDLLRGDKFVVRLLLFDDGQRADPEGHHVADAGGGAHAEDVLAEPGVRSDLKSRLYLSCANDFELRDGETGRVKDDFLRVGEIAAVEDQHGFDTALQTARRRRADRWRCGISGAAR